MLEGPKYDLDRVIRAQLRVLDALVDDYGSAMLSADHNGKGFPWPGKARAISRLFWQKLAVTYDATPNRLIVANQQLTVMVRLLGMTWVVQDAVTGALRLHDGSDVRRINPVPVLSVFGPYDADKKKFKRLPHETLDGISGIVMRKLSHLNLDLECTSVATHETMEAGLTDACRIFFPHDVYGKGRGVLMARCRSSDGGEPEPTHVQRGEQEN